VHGPACLPCPAVQPVQLLCCCCCPAPPSRISRCCCRLYKSQIQMQRIIILSSPACAGRVPHSSTLFATSATVRLHPSPPPHFPLLGDPSSLLLLLARRRPGAAARRAAAAARGGGGGGGGGGGAAAVDPAGGWPQLATIERTDLDRRERRRRPAAAPAARRRRPAPNEK
jgi:hypothetical protein